MVNLFLRSALVLALLFGLVFAVGMAIIVVVGLPPWVAVLFALAVVGLQYLVGPFILQWIYKIKWTDPAAVDPALAAFLVEACAKRKIPVPRFGLIEDGNPNAFTFGHYPGDARLVITRGLLTILEPAEVQAVVGHELGHIAHWDFVVMTLAAAVPLVLYVLYATSRVFAGGSGSSKDRGQVAAIAMVVALVSYVAYLVSQYIVLLLSRVREYFADRFAGELTGDPDKLATALVKIAYGLASAKPAESDDKKKKQSQGDQIRAVAGRSFGIFDPKAAMALALAGAGTGQFGTAAIEDAMKWDLWNPWAIWFELNSSHPLPAKRIKALDKQTEAYGQTPSLAFRAVQTESYWDEFLVDLFVSFLPWVGLAVGGIVGGTVAVFTGWWLTGLGLAVLGWGMAWWLQRRRTYGGRFDQEREIASLVREVKVSAVRPIAATIQGRVIGRGVPGLFYSEDLVLQDDTGFITLDYRQPIGLLNFLFGVFKAEKLIGKSGRALGWYRRAPRPIFEVRHIIFEDGEKVNTYWYPFSQFFVYAAILVGLALTVAGPFFGI